MPRFLHAALLTAALIAPFMIAPAPLKAEDDRDRDRDRRERTYRDEKHHDEHHWNDHEDRAYRMWVKARHRKYADFDRIRPEDQEAYWGWRHEHSDALLHIEIR